MTTIERWSDATAFMRRAEPFLTTDEARHNLTLGIGLTLRNPPVGLVLPAPPYFATIERGGTVLATAIRQPPYGLVVSPAPEFEAGPWLASLAGQVWQQYPNLPSVQGPPSLAWGFADEWQRRGGGAGTLKVSLRIHALDMVRATPPVPGTLRQATLSDRELVVAWMEAMHDEALSFEPPVDAERLVATRLANLDDPLRALYLWQTPDGSLVSICGSSRPTPRGVAINAVYTPPEHRRQGYATAAVGELSRRMLATGRRCYLYTDLANPTSNGIYADIGYVPVCDVVDVGFEGGRGG